MNSFTKSSQFLESAGHIMAYSDLIDMANTVVHDGVVYEYCGHPDNVWRFYFSEDDYDYLVDNAELLALLNSILGVNGELTR